MSNISAKGLALAGALWLAGPALAQMAPGSGAMIPVPGPVGVTSFVGTGGLFSTSSADRSTYSGVRLDARLDFGMACDGSANDTTAWTAAVAQLNLTNGPVTVTFPAVCLINAGAYTISAQVSFEGLTQGAGLKLAAGSTMSANLIYLSTTKPVSCRNFTMDFNNAGVSGNAILTGLLVLNASSMTSDLCRFINGGTVASPSGGLLELYYANSSGTGTFSRDYYHFTAAQSYSNEGLQFKGSNVLVRGEAAINTGIASYGGGTNIIFDGAIVTGFGYGGGITFEPPPGITDTADKHSQIINSVITASTTVQDVNGTKLDGIEVGYSGVLIANNKTSDMCGAGITLYGKDNVIGNHIHNSGTCNVSAYYNSGIVSTTLNSNTASGSFIDANVVDDDGAGNTSYGYSDTSAITGVVFGTNNFHGLLGAYNTSGAVQFAAAQSDNRIVNPCGQINQRNNTTTVVTGKGPDQWTALETAGDVTIGTYNTTIGNCPAGMIATVTTQTTPAAGNIFADYQNIGLGDVRDFNYSSVNAKDGVFAFCATTSLSPPYTGGWFVQNVNSTYTYTGTYKITNAANNRQCFSFRVPGDTHSLGVTNTAIAFRVGFDLGSGSSQVTAPGVWTSGAFYGSTGASPFVSQAVNTTIIFSEIRFFPAGADEGWAPRTLSQELANAQRFAWTTVASGTKPSAALGLNTGEIQFPATIAAAGTDAYRVANPVPMFLGTGTVTAYNPVTAASSACRDETGNADGGAATASNQSALGFLLSCAGNAGSAAGNTLGVHLLVDRGL